MQIDQRDDVAPPLIDSRNQSCVATPTKEKLDILAVLQSIQYKIQDWGTGALTHPSHPL